MAHGFTFGTTFDLDSDTLKEWEESVSDYRELLHWFRWENFFSGSSWFLNYYNTQAMKYREKSRRLYKPEIDNAKCRRQNGDNDNWGLVATMIGALHNHEDKHDDNLITVVRDCIFACSDGAYQILIWALIFATRNPSVQRKIRDEIHSVIGSERMPTLNDREQLLYMEAFIREVLRYSELAALGIPRRAVKNTTLQNTVIEEETLIIVNVYNIHRDPRRWEEPEKFNPERFLEKDGSLRSLSELSYLPFSTGNRSCVGQKLARGFLFLLITRFFQRLTVNTPPGDIIPDSLNQGGSFNPDVKPFKLLVEKVKWA